ncbi:MAG: hypothetical protein ACP5QZ_03000 [Candidatus Sumerlaeaceae bacterium]
MEVFEFAKDDKVEHPVFGKGKVTAVLGDGENAKVIVDFGKEIGEKKLVIRLARLKKLSDRVKLDSTEGLGEHKQ